MPIAQSWPGASVSIPWYLVPLAVFYFVLIAIIINPKPIRCSKYFKERIEPEPYVILCSGHVVAQVSHCGANSFNKCAR